MAERMVSYSHINDRGGVRFSQYAKDPLPAWAVDVIEYTEMTSTEEFEALQAEVKAWRERFPQYVYRPQDECVALKMS